MLFMLIKINISVNIVLPTLNLPNLGQSYKV
jgi:hypothetical protein